MNREERDDERDHPSAIGSRPHLVLDGNLREQIGSFRMVGETQIVDDGLGRIAGRVHGRDRHRPGDAEQAQRGGQCDEPGVRDPPHRDDERDGRPKVARRGEPREPPLSPRRTARGADVAKAVSGERDREQQDERRSGDAERGDHQQTHQDADGAAHHRATQGGGVGPAYAVQDLECAAQREEHADAPERLLGVAERSQQRQHGETGHRDGKRRDRRRLPAARGLCEHAQTQLADFRLGLVSMWHGL